MSWEVMPGLRRRWRRPHDPEVRVVVLAGAGDEAFCAGADLGKMTGADEPAAGLLAVPRGARRAGRGVRALWGLGKPTVARVQGFALAGGFGLALACDLVVASDRARFGAPEVNVGLWPYMITVPWCAPCPPSRRSSSCSRADGGRGGGRAPGVRDPGGSPRELDPAVSELAGTLAAKSPAVMKLGRDAFYAVWDMAAPDALAHLHAMLSLTAQTEDAAEGIAAFLEKRAPKWRGR